MAEERVQRRLAAILAADMVGYSRLMGADEEGVIARQKAHRAELIDPAIADHGGRIVKTMGDDLLVEFASVVDAVQCAVDVQRALVEREAGAAHSPNPAGNGIKGARHAVSRPLAAERCDMLCGVRAGDGRWAFLQYGVCKPTENYDDGPRSQDIPDGRTEIALLVLV